MAKEYSAIEPEIKELAVKCKESLAINPELYGKYEVKRGLRDVSGQGVLTGLTEVSEIRSHIMVDRDIVPTEGKLYYQGVDIEEIVQGFIREKRFGFEETVFLLLFGKLPTKEELDTLNHLLSQYRKELPTSFVRDIIMKAPSRDMMNTLARSVLTLYSYDEKADDTSIENVLRQCLQLIALFPLLSVYGYQAYSHYHDGNSLFIHQPVEGLSTAENILHILRPDSKYTELEAKILDLALVLHAEHGGGNNSTFTTHVVTSSGTDTYSAVAASLGSLKGPKHGGANIKVMRMFEDMKDTIKDWEDEEEVRQYLTDILNKKAFDKKGLIYGMGHAVYSISDPRANILKGFVEKLSVEKGFEKEFSLYSMVERLAPEVIASERKIYKGVSANVDFYSGFVYNMLGLPFELYTPIFAIARIAGWSAHRLEELINEGKIIRPAYKAVAKHKNYVPMEER
ncbi:citrate/2-methylcitrate synthase [Velocimicrobium porci]|uniref:Citrate synthase n=1 Tax=Velocimicrobium porci TaxID=2606634 RepID=A0A6L5XZ07_9FIRM|nr:citrate/2-methylcitrate synthase [Velocimicrobium porci]MSS63849.1 citrate/2-methylcitrate synthase [Velocimicrobium porci]